MGSAYREVLGIRDARSLISASAASQLGDWLYNAALLGYVYSATGSATWVAAATIARLLPYVLLGPVGGVVADRFDRRSVLLVGDVSRCLIMVLLATTVASDGPVALVIAFTALASAAGTAERPAAMALLPRLVGESKLGPANALLHTVQDLGVVVGPALGAVLLAVAPDSVAFLVNGLTFAVSAVFIATMRRGAKLTGTHRAEGVREQLSSGLRTVRATPFVMPLMLVVAMAEMTYGAQAVQLVLYAQHNLDLGASGYGYLLAATGVGGLLSAVFNGRLATSTAVTAIVVTSGAVYCATQLVFPATESLAFALAIAVVGGAGFVACEVVAETALARIVPTAILGRIMGVFDATSVAAMVAGAALAPVLISATSLNTSLAILGAATVLATLLCTTGLRGLDDVSRQRADVLASRVAALENLPIIAGAPRAVLEQLASASHMCPLPPGVDIVVEGAPAHAFYAIIEGHVVIHRGGEQVVRLGPGESFGERGLLDNAPRNATVTTEGDAIVLRLDGAVLLDALQSAPTVLSAVDRSNAPARPTDVEGDRISPVDDPTWVES
jgi:MFS family permease